MGRKTLNPLTFCTSRSPGHENIFFRIHCRLTPFCPCTLFMKITAILTLCSYFLVLRHPSGIMYVAKIPPPQISSISWSCYKGLTFSQLSPPAWDILQILHIVIVTVDTFRPKKQTMHRTCLSLSPLVMPPTPAAVFGCGCRVAPATEDSVLSVVSFTMDEMDPATPHVAVLWWTAGAGSALVSDLAVFAQEKSRRGGLCNYCMRRTTL